jgi:hypothetical protein
MSISPTWWEPPTPPSTVRGLFSVATVVRGADPHLLAGVEYVTNRCGTWQSWDDICDKASTATLNDPIVVTGFSGAVYDSIECVMGLTDAEAERMVSEGVEAKAEAAIEARVQAFIKAEGDDVSSVVGPKDDPRTLIELLEYDAGQGYSHRPILHIDRGTAVAAYGSSVIQQPTSDTDSLQTITGTAVSLGRGYSRSALGAYFAGMTGAVSIALGPVNVITVPGTDASDRLVMGYQPFAVAVECVIGWGEV